MGEYLVIAGHYGSGKTTVSLNLALESAHAGKSVTLVDLDIVNPYFRSGDSAAELENLGIRVIAPQMLGTTSDAPSIRAEVMSAFDSPTDLTIFDAGGDDAGAAVLGRFREKLEQSGYTMLYVINAYRPMTRTPEDCAAILSEIEQVCRLKASGIINNSNLGKATTAQDILNSLPFAQELSRITGLPITAVNVTINTAPDLAGKAENLRVVKRLVKLPWEGENHDT
ncbi:MAG: ParA family protein [Oscillospiraceae bacterium]|jgi:nitrogenase subunit NifH|nr:ParA family protein [Oscillospiraceae bacterium]